MTGCSPRHLVANGSYQDHSEEGNSRCRNVNNKIKGCYQMKFFSLAYTFQPMSLFKDNVFSCCMNDK